jgi:murein L,D-transpeptidase YafK
MPFMKMPILRRTGLIAVSVITNLFFANHTFAQAGSNNASVYGENAFALNVVGGLKSLIDGAPASSDLVPASLIKLDSSYENVIWVEMEKGLLHLMVPNQSSGHWQIGFSRPISIGKAGYGKKVEGDNRTPVGLYHVTSFLPDEELIDYYGNGAFPINYPNAFDRSQNRTGYGIWLHGLPKGVDERPLLDSEGCVVIDNTAFDWLKEYMVEGHTRVLLGDQISWTSSSQMNLLRKELESTIENWRSAWSAIDNDRYLNYYASNFTNGSSDLNQWIEYNNRIHRSKDWIEVEISDLNIFAYPGEVDLIVTEYFQNYRSSNFDAQGKKQIFWQRQTDGSWKIVFEGAA